jgi:uncharacterized protein
MSNAPFDRSIVNEVAHRPWPLPHRPWAMTQSWHNLLFAHWPIDAALLASRVPKPFALDLFDGVAWLGVVPFEMTNVAPRGVPSLPVLSSFAELNVRTYVRMGDRPGIYFFSLDAASAIAVRAARALFNLPYHTADMSVENAGGRIGYRSIRRQGAAEFDGSYEPVSGVFLAARHSLEYFLTERYCLYQHDHKGKPFRLDIHHPPWPLQKAQADLRRNSMAEASGLHTEGAPTLLHFARRLDVVAWLPTRLDDVR